MRGFDTALRNVAPAHGDQQVAKRGTDWIVGKFANHGGELLLWRELGSILGDVTPERSAVTISENAASIERPMNVARSFIPRPESAGLDVFLNALGGPAQIGIFPIVNGA